MIKSLQQKIIKCIKKTCNTINKYKNFIALILTIILISYFSYQYYNNYSYILKDPKRVRDIINSYGKYSVIAFLALQVIQVVIFIIPGEIVQIAGGYIYGIFWGGILSIVGITIGSAITYLISNKLGKPFVKKIIKKDKLSFFERILKKCNNSKIVFILYLIPGLPKDILGYICGISEISFEQFIRYSTLGRLPGIFISTYFGEKITTGDRTALIIIAGIMTLFFIIGVLGGEKLLDKISRKD